MILLNATHLFNQTDTEDNPMGGTSEKTTSSRSDTMKGMFTAINKAKFSFSNDAGKKVSVKTPLLALN